MWFPTDAYKSRKSAQDACQRHFESIIRDLLEVDNDTGAHPSS